MIMQRNKILTILLSLVIAVCLWVYVVSTVTPDDSQWIYGIPVTFVNEDGLFSDPLEMPSGKQALYFRFQGEGAVDFKAFTLFRRQNADSPAP